MDNLTSWKVAVATSLLLHLSALLIVLLNTSNVNQTADSSQILSVELFNQQVLETKIQAKVQVKENKTKSVTQDAISEVKISKEVDKVENNQPPQKGVEENISATGKEETKQSIVNVYPISKLTRPPGFIRKIEPIYPGSEQKAGSQAIILAEVTINELGNVIDVKIVKSASPTFDQAVLDALQKSKFSPGYINQEAVTVKVIVPFRFSLR